MWSTGPVMEANVMNILLEDPVTFVDAALVVRRHFIRSVCSLDSEHFVWENVVLSNTSPWIVQTSPLPFRHGEAQMHHCSWSLLVQVMARRFLMLAKPLAKPVLIYIIHWILRSMKFKSKCKRFHSTKCIWKCLQREHKHIYVYILYHYSTLI